jgi:hypothetical protein
MPEKEKRPIRGALRMKKAPDEDAFAWIPTALRRLWQRRTATPLLRLDVGSLLALRAGRDLEAYALVLGQRLEAGGVDCRKVREHVFTAAVRGNEAETLRIVEPFNSTARHVVTPLKIICCYALLGLVGDESDDASAGLNKAN